MNPEDKAYVQKCISAGIVNSPCLELGGNYEASKLPNGVEHITTDIEPGKCDIIATFGNSDLSAFGSRRFATVIALNLLEHTFEPVKVLDDIVALLEPSGSVVLTSPAIWPLHDYPKDYCRLNPHWYEEYAKSRNLNLIPSLFEYLNDKPVREYQTNGQYYLPPISEGTKRIRSKAAHKLLNTDARGVEFHNYIVIGCVMQKP